jgi:spore maturation protein CgeB
LKILLLSPNQIKRYNWGHQLFRNEIGKQHDVVYYGNGYPNFDKKLSASEIINKYGPFDLLMTYGLRYTLPFQGIGDVKIPKCHIVIDLFPSHPGGYKGSMHTNYKSFIENNKYDFFFYRQRSQAEYLKEIGSKVPSFWLPFSVDIDIYKKLNTSKDIDILTSSTQRRDVYPNRPKINKLIKKMKLRSIQKRVIHKNYVKSINISKICIISTNVFNSPNMKFTEFTSCGSFVLCDKPADFDQLGFKDGYHLVLYSGMRDLEEKIRYYLKNEKEREIIAKNGMKFVRRNHNNTIRAKFLIDQIKRII